LCVSVVVYLCVQTALGFISSLGYFYISTPPS